MINKSQVATAFSRAAHSYEQNNKLQQRTGNVLLAKLSHILPPTVATGLDLGCGSGWFLPQLNARAEQVFALDLSPAMLQQARLKLGEEANLIRLCADMDTVVFAKHSLDFIFANLCMQWSQDSTAWLANWSRCLKPGGVLVFATLVEGSLANLAKCWQAQSLASPINHFISRQQLTHDLENTGKRWHCDYQWEHLTFSDLKSLLHALKGIGANRVNASRASGLLGKARWQQLNATYPRNEKGQCVAEYQLAYGVVYG
ncbi:malonyl-[acyl-carrier protein] O-methyltransferase BioC [Oceanisphaera avium]|uniref:Malonyl-[acyl-carrier protein] O-methyltransferase n=2 Tax=Oceanisphaera avium TaxID=1903694 RepID=A0A1Y0D0J3_9GAMM|nr:malonyl-[acyl-carrier protein] O-methyltransferase BioC [Oceanisphaera avium]